MVLNDGLQVGRSLLGLRLSIFSKKRVSDLVEVSISKTRARDGWGIRIAREH